MPATITPAIASPDNGYFERWTLACGHVVRVQTEDQQFALRRPGARARAHAATRARLGKPGACPECPAAPPAPANAVPVAWDRAETDPCERGTVGCPLVHGNTDTDCDTW